MAQQLTPPMTSQHSQMQPQSQPQSMDQIIYQVVNPTNNEVLMHPVSYQHSQTAEAPSNVIYNVIPALNYF